MGSLISKRSKRRFASTADNVKDHIGRRDMVVSFKKLDDNLTMGGYVYPNERWDVDEYWG